MSAPALAAGRANDAAATQAYLRASEAYARGASAAVGATVTAIDARASEIAGECPSALTYAPRDTAFGEIGEEASATLFYAGLAPMSATTLSFARAIGRLSWSDRRLTRLVRGQAAEEAAFVALAQPDLCADIEAWKASAYAALPQSTTGFLARSEALESGGYVGSSEESREAAILRLLKPYEGPGERRALRQVERQEERRYRTLSVVRKAARAHEDLRRPRAAPGTRHRTRAPATAGWARPGAGDARAHAGRDRGGRPWRCRAACAADTRTAI